MVEIKSVTQLRFKLLKRLTLKSPQMTQLQVAKDGNKVSFKRLLKVSLLFVGGLYRHDKSKLSVKLG